MERPDNAEHNGIVMGVLCRWQPRRSSCGRLSDDSMFDVWRPRKGSRLCDTKDGYSMACVATASLHCSLSSLSPGSRAIDAEISTQAPSRREWTDRTMYDGEPLA